MFKISRAEGGAPKVTEWEQGTNLGAARFERELAGHAKLMAQLCFASSEFSEHLRDGSSFESIG